MNLLYIDLFCGAGGVTTGISQVPGVHVVACVNHDADAIASRQPPAHPPLHRGHQDSGHRADGLTAGNDAGTVSVGENRPLGLLRMYQFQ